MHEFKVGDYVLWECKPGHIVSIGDTHCAIEWDEGYSTGPIRINELRLYNPPLTIQDLEKMDGERVWVENIDEDYSENNRWYKIDSELKKLYQSSKHLVYYSFDYENIKIYRYKPERIDNMENKGCEYCSDLDKYKSIYCEYHYQKAADDIIEFEIKTRYCPNCGMQLIKTFTLSQASAKLSELLGEDVEII